uniref:Rho GTPase-activating protein 7 n=2 Tax=Eptatretus burgeri TaxID=7764 RepID=A0A8C4QTX4_EPTBU
MADTGPLKPPLRRSFSDHVRSSTARAWDLIWRSVRDRRLAEIEVLAACKWLQEAGFPQYTQLHRDDCLPFHLSSVWSDHEFLDQESFECLYRRLAVLSKHSLMKLEIGTFKLKDDNSDDEDDLAISSKWTYETSSGRWLRITETQKRRDNGSVLNPDKVDKGGLVLNIGAESPWKGDAAETGNTSSRKELDIEPGERLSSSDSQNMAGSVRGCPGSTAGCGPCGEQASPGSPRRRGLLKRVENLSFKRKTRHKLPTRREGLVISGPFPTADSLERPACQLQCFDLQNDQTLTWSSRPTKHGDFVGHKPEFNGKCDLQMAGYRGGTASYESLMFQLPLDHKPGTFPRALSSDTYILPEDHDVNWHTGSFHLRATACHSHGANRTLSSESILAQQRNVRAHKARCNSCESLLSRVSIYDNVPTRHGPGNSILPSLPGGLEELLAQVVGLQRTVASWTRQVWLELEPNGEDDAGRACGRGNGGDSDSCGGSSASAGSPGSRRSPPGHSDADTGCVTASDGESTGDSLTELDRDGRPSEGSNCRDVPDSEPAETRASNTCQVEGLSVQELTAVQLCILRKLALLRLTGLLEKHSSSNKIGWSWPLPRFMRRTKGATEMSERGAVFGASLTFNAQRSGHALPHGIQLAIAYLQEQGSDQVGLFRKSGVKSRIQALREMNQSTPGAVDYTGQSPYDVADMLKQYFRDLPEPLLTSKLSETLLLIFQTVPVECQVDAAHATLLLLPAESREALQTLLALLSAVACRECDNHMPAGNLALCLAPSLFHLTTLRREGSSSRSLQRKPSVGKPDQRELGENQAATQALSLMIRDANSLFLVPSSWLPQVQTTSEQFQWEGPRDWDEASEPVNALNLLESRLQQIRRECRGRARGWRPMPSVYITDLAYRKHVGGHLLPQWKSSIEIPAPPVDVLERLLHERDLWDTEVLHAITVQPVAAPRGNADLYHYVCRSVPPLLPRSHVLLRLWSELAKGAWGVACLSVRSKLNDGSCEVAGPCLSVEVIDVRYLIELAASGRSRLTYICCCDTKGREAEWYRKVYGHLCAAELVRIRDSFSPDP